MLYIQSFFSRNFPVVIRQTGPAISNQALAAPKQLPLVYRHNMGSQQTPTFVITPGAWHPASAADLLVNELSAAGFPAQAVGLKTVGAYGPMTDDTKYLRDEVYIPLIESGKDIVVVLHSYGGFPGSTAIQGLGKKDRQGKAGGIVGIVYIAAFVPQEGMSLKANCGGVVPDWQQADVRWAVVEA